MWNFVIHSVKNCPRVSNKLIELAVYQYINWPGDLMHVVNMFRYLGCLPAVKRAVYGSKINFVQLKFDDVSYVDRHKNPQHFLRIMYGHCNETIFA
jgi:hypothetical protein